MHTLTFEELERKYQAVVDSFQRVQAMPKNMDVWRYEYIDQDPTPVGKMQEITSIKVGRIAFKVVNGVWILESALSWREMRYPSSFRQ